MSGEWITRLRTPAIKRAVSVGDVSITYIPDGYVELEPARWFQNKPLPSAPVINDGGYFVGSVGSIVVHDRDGITVIDAGFGPVTVPSSHTHPSLGAIHGGANSAFTSHFQEPVIALAVTHAHDDHVGWFKAQHQHLTEHEVHVGKPDLKNFQQLTGRDKALGLSGGERLSTAVRALATPGHTAGHMSYIVESIGHRAVIFGDVFHNPLQFKDVTLTPWSDELPDLAVQSRQKIMRLLQEENTIGVGYHFGDMVFGQLDGTEWTAVATD